MFAQSFRFACGKQDGGCVWLYFFFLADHEMVTGSSLRAAYLGPRCHSLVPAFCGGRGWIRPQSSGEQMQNRM